jgi:hypothetical protein
VTALLNLAEFMEHDDKRLPLDTRTLGALAEKCHAFAKARLAASSARLHHLRPGATTDMTSSTPTPNNNPTGSSLQGAGVFSIPSIRY